MLLYLLLFIIGAAVGSFLNVLIDRLPRGESIRGRSYCESCATPLPWFDLIPLFSFLWLGGKCRYCGARIPLRLPLVELLTGIGFVAIFLLLFGNSLLPFTTLFDTFRGGKEWLSIVKYSKVVYSLFLYSAFLVLFFTDLEYGVLPDVVIIPTVVVTVFWRFFFFSLYTKYQILNTKYWLTNLEQYAIPAVVLAGFFMFIILITRGRGMGFGDVKLGFLIGLVLGWPGTLVAAFLAFLFGGVVSVILLLSGKKKFGQVVPFGPFLIAGTAMAALWGSVVWEWYVLLL